MVGDVVGELVAVVVCDVVGVVIWHPVKSPYKCDSIMSLIKVARSVQLSSATESTSPKQAMSVIFSDAPTVVEGSNSEASRARPAAIGEQDSSPSNPPSKSCTPSSTMSLHCTKDGAES